MYAYMFSCASRLHYPRSSVTSHSPPTNPESKWQQRTQRPVVIRCLTCPHLHLGGERQTMIKYLTQGHIVVGLEPTIFNPSTTLEVFPSSVEGMVGVWFRTDGYQYQMLTRYEPSNGRRDMMTCLEPLSAAKNVTITS